MCCTRKGGCLGGVRRALVQCTRRGRRRGVPGVPLCVARGWRGARGDFGGSCATHEEVGAALGGSVDGPGGLLRGPHWGRGGGRSRGGSGGALVQCTSGRCSGRFQGALVQRGGGQEMPGGGRILGLRTGAGGCGWVVKGGRALCTARDSLPVHRTMGGDCDLCPPPPMCAPPLTGAAGADEHPVPAERSGAPPVPGGGRRHPVHRREPRALPPAARAEPRPEAAALPGSGGAGPGGSGGGPGGLGKGPLGESWGV